MKPLCYFLLFSCMFLWTGCRQDSALTVIEGTFSGMEEGSEITYSVPIDGTSYAGFRRTVKVDANGKFTITLEDIGKQGVVFLQIPDVSYFSFPVFAGQNIQLTIERESDTPVYRFAGPNEEGLNLYANSGFVSSLHEAHLYSSGLRNLNEEEMAEETKQKKESQLSRFRELKEKKAISEDFYRFVESDRDCFYAFAEIYYLLPRWFSSEQDEAIGRRIEELFNTYPPTADRFTAVPVWFEYAQWYAIHFKLWQSGKLTREMAQQLHGEGRLHTVFLEETENYFTGKQKEFFIAAYIYYAAFQNQYEEELINLFDSFQNKYPKSKYNSFIEPLIDDIRVYYEKVHAPRKESIRIMEDYETINSLAEAVKPFKGKKVYVDVWATWCGPCKREFGFKDALHDWLVANEYEVLYISIDDDRQIKQWKEMLVFYDLEGTHMKANQLLDADLRRIYDQGGGLSIPWYILVDENGEIEEKHMKRPSQIAEERK